MKKQQLFSIAVALLLSATTVFGQAQKSAKSRDLSSLKSKKTLVNEMSPTAHSVSTSNTVKAAWDLLYSFNAQAAGQQAIETDGNFIYTTGWQETGVVHKYTMTGTFVEDITVTGISAIRDLAYDGTYFYGAAANMNLFKIDMSTGTLVSTIAATCSGVTGIRHCAYDPTLDGGNGGFWIGNWSELGAISKTGTQLVANITGNADCYGSAYDNWTNQSSPRLLLFQQGGSGVEIHAFDITTSTFQGLVHDAADVPNFNSTDGIAGGLCTYEANGKFIVLGNVQQDPNLIFAYELATTASPSAPNVATALTVTPDAGGALTYDISWTNPTIDVQNNALVDITSISFYVDEVLVTGLTYNLGVGATNSFTAQSVATPGNHTFKVVCTNGSGDGLPASVTEWIGYIPPANITFNTIEDITANVAWTQEGTPASWDIEIVLDGVAATGTPTYNTTNNPYGFTGLTAATTYDVYMRAVYGGGNSVWVGPFSFTTLPCPSANQCVFVLGFTDSYGDGWNGAAINITQNGTSLGNFTIATGTSGTQNVSLCNGATINVNFVSGSYDEECGFTLTDPFGNVLYSFAVADEPAAGLLYTFTSSCTPPACPKPTALTASAFTLTGATLGWTAGGTETTWNVEIGLAGFTPTGTPTNTGVTNPFVATGLTSSSAYEYYVQADCGGDQSTWAGPFAFNTACETVNQFAWTEDFESGITCYNVSGINADQTWYLDDGTSSTPLSGTNTLTCLYDDNLADQDEWIKSPVFDLTSLTAPQITFNWNMSFEWSVTNPNYDIFLKVTTDGTNWTEIWTQPTTFTDWTWYDTTLSISAYNSATFQFAFQYVGNDGAAAYIEDITIDNSTSTNNVVVEKSINVYPNPSTGIINISEMANEVMVYDLVGNQIMSETFTKTLNISNLAKGMYIVKVKNNDQVRTFPIQLIK